MSKVYLSLGSNIGEKLLNLRKAIELLESHNSILNIKISSFYKTAPQGFIDQDIFLNCVVSFDTTLNPFELLKYCQDIEKKLKRVRLFKWGPRIIDVDIILFGDEVINTPDLTIPHPRMFERAFVLVPLSELNPEYKDKITGLEDQEIIKI